jgi:hypothetical protein
MPADPFGTAAIRERVLAAWAASAARFREDANAEEDLVHGAYRDRLLVELAQNAADAAVRAGRRGVLRLSLVDGELRAANTGVPLDAAGVEALATLRASAKRDAGTVGRFGVGFAAVRAVTDAPAVLSTGGGVRFSAADTLAEASRLPALADELRRRDGQVPALRLPWPEERLPPEGYATEVRLPLRPGAEPAVRAALDGLDVTILLALPGLAAIEVGERVLSREDGPDGTVVLRDGERVRRFRVRSATGVLPPDLLTGRPVEERDRPEWTVTWAVPVDGAGAPVPLPERQVVHAPTPSEEPLSVPARLVATFPLGPDRRHVASGPITDLLVAAAADVYAALIAELPPTPALLALVPRPGLAAAELDAALCRALLDALRATPWLPTAAVPVARVAPVDATVVDAANESLVDALAGVVAGLLPAGWSGRSSASLLGALGVRRLGTADVVDLVSGVDRPPSWWRRLYDGLADAPDREALAALPVPLTDGRVVTGVRHLLLPAAGLPAGAAAALGLRVVHPDAVHPLLERLGAVPTAPRAVLADDRVRAAVEASYDEEDPAPVAEAVLALVAAAGVTAGEEPWLAELVLPDAAGDWRPAGELLLPGAPFGELLVPQAPLGRVDAGFAERWGNDPLTAVGVLDTFAVLRAPDAEIGFPEHDLDGEEDWHDALLDLLPPQPAPPRLAELVAVRDLELVRPDAWPAVLPMVAALPAAHEQATAVLADGRHMPVPSYTRWWLRTHPIVDGRSPERLRLPAAADLAGLYDAAAGDEALLRFAGCLTGLADALADADRAEDLLHRLGDPARTAPAATLRDVYARLALALDGADPDVPATVRVAPDRVAPRESAVVLDVPYLLPLLAGRAVLPAGGAPGPVADLLGLPFASEVVTADVDSEPARRLRWAEVPGAALAAERCESALPVTELAVHDRLLVTGGVRAGWWAERAVDHVDASAGSAALGRALAWRLDRWDRRAAAAEAFAEPAAGDRLRAEDAV